MYFNISSSVCQKCLAFTVVTLIMFMTVIVYRPLNYFVVVSDEKFPIRGFERCKLAETHGKQPTYARLNQSISVKNKISNSFHETHMDLYKESQSTCNDAASSRGPHQQVVAFSFYGKIDHERNYFKGIEENAELMEKFYPNWIMRVYYDVLPEGSKQSTYNNTLNITVQEILCHLERTYPNLDLCCIEYIPGFGNLSGSQGNMWRFLPMADPLVDVFVSRDLDSRPSDRELAAVNQWLASNLTFHIMRDHPYHKQEILAGMWGAVTYKEREKLANLTRIMIHKGKHAKNKGLDQKILKNILWPVTNESSMQHDSYHCKTFGRHRLITAWPTRRRSRENYNFVGARIGVDKLPLSKPCPILCRPKNKTHWVHC